MKKVVFSSVFAFLCVVSLMGAPQDDNATPSKAASGPAAKLRDDLKKAVMNANLTDAQKKKLQDAGVKLRDAATAKQSGEKVDRGSLKKALSDIKEVVNSGAFKPEDTAAVKADLEALKEARGGPSRRGLLRRR